MEENGRAFGKRRDDNTEARAAEETCGFVSAFYSF
jgi:hypothetical protein